MVISFELANVLTKLTSFKDSYIELIKVLFSSVYLYIVLPPHCRVKSVPPINNIVSKLKPFWIKHSACNITKCS